MSDYNFCPECGAEEPVVWSNGSGDRRCDNCGWEDQEEES